MKAIVMEKEKEVTQYDLARKLNTSIAAVCRALKEDRVVNTKTREKISGFVETMGSRPDHFAPSITATHTILLRPERIVRDSSQKIKA